MESGAASNAHEILSWTFVNEYAPLTVRFRRGDTNADDTIDISDGIGILSFLFTGGKASPCKKAADTNDDGTLDISDGVALLGHLFLGGKAPPEPMTSCGTDPTMDELTCDSFPPCEQGL